MFERYRKEGSEPIGQEQIKAVINNQIDNLIKFGMNKGIDYGLTENGFNDWENPVEEVTKEGKYKADLFISPGLFCSLHTKLPQLLMFADLVFVDSPVPSFVIRPGFAGMRDR